MKESTDPEECDSPVGKNLDLSEMKDDKKHKGIKRASS